MSDEREEWAALASADTLHLLPPEALIAAVRHLASRLLTLTCPLTPHGRGLVYDADRDIAVCPLCGHEQYEEMGG